MCVCVCVCVYGNLFKSYPKLKVTVEYISNMTSSRNLVNLNKCQLFGTFLPRCNRSKIIVFFIISPTRKQWIARERFQNWGVETNY